MSDTCASCRWWQTDSHDVAWEFTVDGREIEVPQPNARLGVRDGNHDLVIPPPFELRYCRSPKARTNERPEIDGAAVIDGSEYWARLVTGPDFGCIHWVGRAD